MSTTQILLQNTVHGTASGNYDGSSLDFASDAANGPGYYQGIVGQQTVAIRVSDFNGVIELQGTLDCVPNSTTNWITLQRFDLSDSTPSNFTQTVQVEGKFTWIRARVVNFMDGTINTVTSTYAGPGIDTSDTATGMGVFDSVTANVIYVGTGGVDSSGNIAGNYILGNGSLLTGITPTSSYGNSDVASYLASGFGSPGFDSVVTGGNIVAGVIDTGAIVNQFPLGIQTNNGYVWQFAGNILRSPEGGTWASSADTEYFSSTDNGFIHLHALQGGNVVTDLLLEHDDVQITVGNGGAPKTWEFNNSGTTVFPSYTFPYEDGNAGEVLKTDGAGNLSWSTDTTDYGNANVVAYAESGWAGNLIPAANVTYSLGNATNYWSNLWVASNTIFIGGVPLGVSGNTLTVNGEPVGNVDADLPTYGGNILVDYLIGNTTDNSGYLQWEGNSSGDNNGYTTLRLVPDDTLVSNDQYLIVDPTAPNHIHIRAGGTQDASQAELYLGGEANYVQVADGIGVTLQNQTRNDTFYTYSDPTDFNTGTWYESGGTFFVQYTTANAELINVSFQFNNDNENTLRVYYNAGANNAVLTSAGSVSNLGGGVYRVSVNEAPPANPTAISEFEYEIWSTRTNSVTLSSNDFTVDVTDDLRLTGNDTVSLRNRSATDPITIRTDYDGADRGWEFAADGTLSTPGDIVVNGDVTGTAGASTLVVRAEPGSNTAIQLNDIVDSEIRTVANLEIRTDVSNTARVWQFDTTGNLTAPGDITTTGNITGNFILADLQVVATGDVTGSNIVGISSVQTANVYATNEVSATGNVIGGNLVTTGQVSATGNISGANLIYTDNFVVPDNFEVAANNSVLIEFSDTSNNSTFFAQFDEIYLTVLADSVGTDLRLNSSNVTISDGSGGASELIVIGNVSAGNFIVSESLIGSDASPQPTISGFSTISATGNITGANLSVTGNITTGNILTDGYYYANGDPFSAGTTYSAGNGIDITGDVISVDANVVLTSGSQNVETTGNITAANFVGNISITGNVTGTSSNVDLIADTYQWSFDNTGNLTLPGNTFAVNYANGTAVALGGSSYGNADVEAYLPTYTGNLSPGNILTDNYFYANGDPFVSSNYGNSNVVTLLGSFGSNTISTTGNVSGGNLITAGVAEITGNATIGNITTTNITGTAANVTITANAYVTTFDTTGLVTFPGNINVTGNVITPNRPAFRVYGNGVTSVSTTTNTTGVLNGNNWAVDYNQGDHLNSTTGVFTAPVAGLYQVNLNARVANNVGAFSQAIVYKNSGSGNVTQVMWETAANCTVNHFGVGTVSKLAVGDTLFFAVTSGELTFDANDSWSVAFLG